MSAAAIERYVGDYRALAADLPGAALPWLRRAREEAIARFAAEGFPTRHHEDWKYTSVDAIEKQVFLPAFGAAECRLADTAPWRLGEHTHHLVFVDGRHAPALSRLLPLPQGAVVKSLAEVLARLPQLAEPWLCEDGPGAFAALNTAFLSDGAFIHLGAGVAIEEPIHLLFLATAPGMAACPRNVIVADAGAHVTVVEQYVGLADGATLTNAVTRIVAGRDARIEHCKLQQESDAAFHVASIRSEQAAGSGFVSHSLSFGAALARNDISTRFDGARCETLFNGLYVVGGRQHVDHQTRIDHAQPCGTSREFYRGVLDGRSRGAFTGRVVVHKDAQRTDAAQANHNLLLSREAEVDTRPQLEIYADDVKCSHGATVGQLDENTLFYLRSRGIEEALARDLLTYAFAREVIERIRLGSVRASVGNLLASRLPNRDKLRHLA
jgi:Fe-S cluster assembly protein SufD